MVKEISQIMLAYLLYISPSFRAYLLRVMYNHLNVSITEL